MTNEVILEWTTEVLDNSYIRIPEGLLEAMGWKSGDELIWTEQEDGIWSLDRINHE